MDLTRRDPWIALGVFAAALASRLAFLAASPDRSWPHSAYHEGDAIVWAQWAEAIATGRAGEFNSGLPFHPPAVAYLIAALGPAGAGLGYAALKVLWCVMSAAACGAAYLAFAYAFPRRVVFIASAWCAFSFALGVAATSLNNETPYLLLVCLIVLGTLRLADRPRLWLAAGVGVLHGLANLTRAEHTLLVAMLLGYLVWRWRGVGRTDNAAVADVGKEGSEEPRGRWHGSRHGRWHQAAMLGMIAVMFVLTCLAWSIHATRANARYNTTVTFRPDYDAMTPSWEPDARALFDSLPEFCKRWLGAYLYTNVRARGYDRVSADRLRTILLEDFGYIPEPVRAVTLVAGSGPLAFALANHPAARGGFSKAALDARYNPDPDITLALPSHLRLYNHGWAAGLGFIRDDPRAWAKNVGVKVLNFWSGVTLGLTSRNLPYGRVGERRPVDMITHDPGAAPWWRALVSLAIVSGIVLSVWRRQGGIWLIVIAYKIVVTVLFFGYARQAVSILPAFALFGALALDAVGGRMPDRLAASRAHPWLVGAVAAALVILDLSALFSRSRVVIDGPVRDAPEWGQGAFQSPQRLRVRWAAEGPPGVPVPDRPP